MGDERIKELDKYFPPAGHCAFCGFHDKRHRLWDVLIAGADAGRTAEEIASWYELSLDAVRLVLEIRPYTTEIAQQESQVDSLINRLEWDEIERFGDDLFRDPDGKWIDISDMLEAIRQIDEKNSPIMEEAFIIIRRAVRVLRDIETRAVFLEPVARMNIEDILEPGDKWLEENKNVFARYSAFLSKNEQKE